MAKLKQEIAEKENELAEGRRSLKAREVPKMSSSSSDGFYAEMMRREAAAQEKRRAEGAAARQLAAQAKKDSARARPPRPPRARRSDEPEPVAAFKAAPIPSSTYEPRWQKHLLEESGRQGGLRSRLSNGTHSRRCRRAWRRTNALSSARTKSAGRRRRRTSSRSTLRNRPWSPSSLRQSHRTRVSSGQTRRRRAHA